VLLTRSAVIILALALLGRMGRQRLDLLVMIVLLGTPRKLEPCHAMLVPLARMAPAPILARTALLVIIRIRLVKLLASVQQRAIKLAKRHTH